MDGVGGSWVAYGMATRSGRSVMSAAMSVFPPPAAASRVPIVAIRASSVASLRALLVVSVCLLIVNVCLVVWVGFLWSPVGRQGFDPVHLSRAAVTEFRPCINGRFRLGLVVQETC